MLGRISILFLIVLVAAALSAPLAVAADARYEGASVGGSAVFFTTAEAPALLGDTDLKTDVYMRSYDPSPGIEDFVTRKISTGPAGGNSGFDAFFAGTSEDGKRVFFSTQESLVSADTDHAADLYMRDIAASKTTLVSVPDPSCVAEDCGNAELNASFVLRGVTPDGSKAFFITSEPLSAEDGDSVADVYRRDVLTEETTLVSAGDPSCEPEGCGGGPVPVLSFDDASASGNRVTFRSEEKLAPGDADGGQPDIFQRNVEAGTTALVSVSGQCPGGGACVPTYGGSSPDGAHVIFETSDKIGSADEDSSQDVYDWSGGTPALVSTGPGGGNGAVAATFPGVVSGYPGISADGARVFFESDEQLVGADEDGTGDVYERVGGETRLVSRRDPSCEPATCENGGAPAFFRWISPAGLGSAVAIGTQEQLDPADTDKAADVYERSGASTTLLSTGPIGGNAEANASFAGAALDETHIFFVTAEQLVSLDQDASSDIYDGSGGSASLVSTGPVGGNGPFSSGLSGVSEDGGLAFFATDERLTVDDKDGEERDVYQRSPTGTLLVSTGNLVALGPPPPSLLATDPPSPGESTKPRIQGQAEAGAVIQIYTNGSCSGEPLEAGTAEQLSGAGIQVSVAAGSTTKFWLTAEGEGITSPCAGPLTYRHEGSGSGGSEDGYEEGGGQAAAHAKPGRSTSVPGLIYFTPKTRITYGPSFKTRRHKAVFRFTDATGQPGTSFVCKLDRRRWHGCDSPKQLRGLSRGRHVFAVKAVNATGEWEPRPSRRRFEVVGR
jgi:Tol biopolymer transport system component